jgi:hypothetical protein
MSRKRSRNSEAHSPGDPKRFFVVAMPRSGTAWLANFLTWGNSFCYHEALYGCESMDRLDEILRKPETDFCGTSDTASAYLISSLYERYPDARYVFVVRPREEIYASLGKLNIGTDGLDNLFMPFWWGMRNIQNSLIVHFEHLFSSTTMISIWEHIGMTQPFPFALFELLRNLHVEDGYGSGFGRFIDHDVVLENQRRFAKLIESLDNVAVLEIGRA